MIKREEYLQQLISFKDKQLIKVVTGIRRCGKSTLLELFTDEIKKSGVSKQQIISVNFEDADNEHLTDRRILYSYIKERLINDKMNYIILDEIQHVDEWQRTVDSLFIKKNCDVYITGSNAYLLSGELATLLSGRYVEIKMLPLSFSEYISAKGDKTDLQRKYNSYLTNSSFPYTLELNSSKDIRAYLDGIYNSIVLKDVVSRKRISDVSALESVIRFMFDNIGNITNSKNIADTLTYGGRKISTHTVDSYLEALCDSFIFYKAGRFDVKGKQYLKTGEKYYAADIGLRYYLLGSQKSDMGRALENVVYLELLRRGCDVRIGKVGSHEVDFVAANEGGVAYYQAALTVRDESTLARELRPLDSISDHNPKYLLTLDDDPETSHNGIRQINALDWLLSPNTSAKSIIFSA
ncbi:MAG: ATP-binding protein [Clostridiales bacterium]|jgi:predicted AAA+ superfamily ATPase|nr:ATP-binding protein [Clostridiales bacterium]